MRKVTAALLLLACFFMSCEKEEVWPTDKGLILHLPFNSSLNDASNDRNNATIVGGTPSFVQNRFFDQNSALRLVRGQYLEVADKKFNTLKAFTFYIEFYPTSDDYQVLLGKRAYTVTPGTKYNQSFNIAINDIGQARAQFRRIGQCQNDELSAYQPELNSGNEDVMLDCWNYVASTFDGRVQKLYLNGKLVSQQNLDGIVICDTDPLRIGAWWKDNPLFFSGVVDEVRVYDRALSDGEIFEIYKYAKR